MTGPAKRYVVAGSRPWNRAVFDELIGRLAGSWRFVATRDELEQADLATLAPRYVFFLHWSWKVPPAVFDRHECVVFHMTDLPYGRGGSPLQNLILRGHRETKLTALRMTGRLDAGPVYLKRELSLAGTAAEIYERGTRLSVEMIGEIIREQPRPEPQTGEVVVFERRRPRQSELPAFDSVQQLYDFIRMLDCDGYPRAFFTRGGLRYELRNAALSAGRLTAEVRVAPSEETT